MGRPASAALAASIATNHVPAATQAVTTPAVGQPLVTPTPPSGFSTVVVKSSVTSAAPVVSVPVVGVPVGGIPVERFRGGRVGEEVVY